MSLINYASHGQSQLYLKNLHSLTTTAMYHHFLVKLALAVSRGHQHLFVLLGRPKFHQHLFPLQPVLLKAATLDPRP